MTFSNRVSFILNLKLVRYVFISSNSKHDILVVQGFIVNTRFSVSNVYKQYWFYFVRLSSLFNTPSSFKFTHSSTLQKDILSNNILISQVVSSSTILQIRSILIISKIYVWVLFEIVLSVLTYTYLCSINISSSYRFGEEYTSI